jgi:glycosyltransferase involved in cell wall biosynthesis
MLSRVKAAEDVIAQKESWIALLGRRDTPTDGVEDYCTFLGRALEARGIELKQERVPWFENGWIGALLWLAREGAAWRGKWVLLQYTALTWSRRGFPFFALAVAAILRRAGVRVAVVFHDPKRQGGSHWIDGIRGACQDWVLRKLYRGAATNIFTVPLETVAWLPKDDAKAAFIPIGANIPECETRRLPLPADQQKRVIVFGVTGPPAMAREVEEIVWVMRETTKKLGKLRLVVVGRGALEAREQLVSGLQGHGVEVVVLGVLPAEEIAGEFARADVLLFLRGTITHQRGSAMAGIASGIPIVGYRDGSIVGPLAEAGIEWSPRGDRDTLVSGLARVLSEPSRWLELHERNLEAQKNWISWNRIADLYRMVLAE